MQAENIIATSSEPATTSDVVTSAGLQAEPILDALARLLARHVIAEITAKSPSQEPLP